ncbi:uncharacterized protein LOC105846040 isoform X1 [Hydra vulgaris]|uniref:uncharacterized protein LOC105846040 isoform X1 n=1 Tax=Hydra vulgaris TaxID=6087 RepID=UPI0006412D6C|nr:uncharacterized protein LOC105846040 [Hydra vulgaris]
MINSYFAEETLFLTEPSENISSFNVSLQASSVIFNKDEQDSKKKILSTSENAENIRNANEEYSSTANTNISSNHDLILSLYQDQNCTSSNHDQNDSVSNSFCYIENKDNAGHQDYNCDKTHQENKDITRLQDCDFNEMYPENIENSQLQDCNEIHMNTFGINFDCDNLPLSKEVNATSCFVKTNDDEQKPTAEDHLPSYEKLVTLTELKSSTEKLRRKQLPTYLSLSREFLYDEPPKYELVTGKQLNSQLDLAPVPPAPTSVSSSRQIQKRWRKYYISIITIIILVIIFITFLTCTFGNCQ